jgi:predicted ATPase/DNA-binding SARP family transcriptional activator/tetratricopeptide (TPR) repeat protein
VLTVAVLGPVEVHRDDVRLAVPAGRTTEVLVRLALDASQVVSADRLIDDLWPNAAARNTLQAKVSKLRRALGDPDLIVSAGAGYALAVDPGCVDALEVLRIAGTLPALRRDPGTAVRVCAAALAMFRGDLLPAAGDGDWLGPHRARLAEARLSLIEDHLAARLELGATFELVGELEELVCAHPLSEGLWRLLITVLYRSGRQADALAAYRRVQQRLGDELGLDPGPELRALERQVLRQDLPLTAAATPRGNLTGLPTPLIGRDADLDEIGQLLGAHRLVTVTGPAGVGKTRLAIELGRGALPEGGAWLVRLENARTAEAVWQSVGEAFGIGAASDAIALDRLRGSRLLLILDNCEQLVDTLPAIAERLLTVASGLRILATSQLPLGMDGEIAYPLGPLAIPDSIALFTQRAARHRRSFGLDGDTGPVIEQVCRSLDGLPLAIELAAARVKALSVQEIARRLDDRFTLLSDPAGHRPPRQRALRAALAWSYDLLFPDDQRGLWALAAFPGGAPLTAAEEVLTALGVPAASALDVLARLADRSLAAVEIGRGGLVRYRLLDSVRAFGLEQLHASGSADAAFGAHATWYAAAGDRCGSGVRGPDQADHLTLARVERANIDAAMTWAEEHDPLLGLRIVNGFAWAWALLGAGSDTAQRVRVAAAAAGATAADRATGLLLAGWLEASGGNLDSATADLEQGMALGGGALRRVGELYLAFVRTQQGRAAEALDLLDHCRPAFQDDGSTWEEGASWLLSAWALIALGETTRGKAACDEALRLLAPLGDQWALNHAEGLLGGLAQAQQRYADATVHLRRAADATHRLGFAAAEAHHLANLGRAQEQCGEQPAAVATFTRAVETAHSTGDLRTAALAGARLARATRFTDPMAARAAAQWSHRWYSSAGGGDALLLTEYVLAALEADADRLVEIIATARAAHDIEIEVLALDAVAQLHAQHGDEAGARTALADAETAMAGARHLLSHNDRADRARTLQQLEPVN